MIYKYLIPLLIFTAIALFEITILPWAAINKAIPQLSVILLVLYTHVNGQLFGTILGFLFGIIYDLLSGGLLGLGMFSFTAAGFLAGYFHNENKIAFYDEPHFFILSVFLSSFVYSLLYSLASIGDISYNFWILLIEHTLLPATYTAGIALILPVFRKVRSFR